MMADKHIIPTDWHQVFYESGESCYHLDILHCFIRRYTLEHQTSCQYSPLVKNSPYQEVLKKGTWDIVTTLSGRTKNIYQAAVYGALQNPQLLTNHTHDYLYKISCWKQCIVGSIQYLLLSNIRSYAKLHFTSTLVVMSPPESNSLSMSASFAFSWSLGRRPKQTGVAQRHACEVNTEQVLF